MAECSSVSLWLSCEEMESLRLTIQEVELLMHWLNLWTNVHSTMSEKCCELKWFVVAVL